MNGVMIQYFHWYHAGDLWNEFARNAAWLSNLGFTAAWLPPANKCHLGREGRGYDVYDLYDLGEFDQKGGIATRYGTKEEYLNAIKEAHKAGIDIYADIVLNHRMGADEKEDITVHEVHPDDRNAVISGPMQVSALTRFTFPGRNGTYSDFIWDHQCFSGIDIVTKDNKEVTGIFKIHNDSGTDWTDDVSHQLGNYDYLMGADVEYRNPQVIQEMKNWIRWYMETTGANGVRLDALKHLSSGFLKEFITYIRTEINPDCFVLGEFWKDEAGKMDTFSKKMDHLISCFDVPLHYNFFKASEEGKKYDLTRILEGSFLEKNPALAVSFVENHDTQPLQALESSVKAWFKPLAYAVILLSDKAYPCVFYPDLFGAEYTDERQGEEVSILLPKIEVLPALLKARHQFAHGEQINCFDDPNCIAWIRKGNETHTGCVVILSNGEEAAKELDLGSENGHTAFRDFLGHRQEEIMTDRNGKAAFTVNAASVSVWVRTEMISPE